MSTGIISLACQFMGNQVLALALFGVNGAFFIILWCLTLLRLGFFPGEVWSDLASHSRSLQFFTLVAGTCILGSQCLLVGQAPGWGAALLGLGGVLEVLFIYAIFGLLITRPAKPAFPESINGDWFLITVSLQSLAVLGCLVAPHLPPWRETLQFMSLCLFLLGFFLYFPVIILVVYRLWFFALDPEAFEPPYWIAMGAGAITTLAGSVLAAGSQGSGLTGRLEVFILGVTVLAWATATFFIPLLVVLMIWRHGVRRVPLAYSPDWWAWSFPWGCTAPAPGTWPASPDLRPSSTWPGLSLTWPWPPG
jgi:tellurite resistance protein TehA-like permease